MLASVFELVYANLMKCVKGKIVIPADVNVWQHELTTAQALAHNGYDVTFLTIKAGSSGKNPDILMMGVKWEIKSPKTDKLSAIERNLKRATKQSGNIIIDSHRLHKLRDVTVQTLLIQKLKQQKSIRRLIYINRKREAVDIGTLI